MSAGGNAAAAGGTSSMAGGTSGAASDAGGCEFPVDPAGPVQLRLDLAVVTVTLELTLNGRTMPDSPRLQSRGRFAFLKSDTAGHLVPVPAIGPARVTTPLFAGTYDIAFIAFPDAVDLPKQGRVVLARGVTLTSNQTLTYDATTALVAASLTLNGGAMAEATSPTRGRLTFRDLDGQWTASADLPARGAATTSALLFASRYQVVFESSAGAVAMPSASRTVLDPNFVVTSARQMAWNLRTLTVRGAVTKNGSPLEEAPGTSGRAGVVFIEVDTNSSAFATLPATGPAAYQLQLFPGTYDVGVARGTVGLSTLPIGRKLVRRRLVITSDLVLSLDVPVVSLTFTLTFNGGQLPDAAAGSGRASVQLFNADEFQGDFGLGSTGAGTSTGPLYTGAYTAKLSPDSRFTELPAWAHVMGQLTINASGTQTMNVEVGTVTGELTVNGSTMPDSPGLAGRGTLTLLDHTLGQTTGLLIPLGARGPATFARKIYGGRYTGAFSPATDVSGMPGVGVARLGPDLVLAPGQTIRLDARWTTISGEVTFNGATPPPTSLGARGSILFEPSWVRAPVLQFSSQTQVVSATGPLRFAQDVFAGDKQLLLLAEPGQAVLSRTCE